MKSLLFAVIASITCCQALADDDVEAKPLDSGIREVTVYSDRARVVRTAKIALEKGSHRYAFNALPGWIDEQSVRLALSPASGGQIADVKVRRVFLAEAGEKEVTKAEALVQELTDDMAALDDEVRILTAQSKQIESIRAFSTEKLPKDAAVRTVDMDEYGNVVSFVTRSLTELAARKREIAVEKRKMQPELSARRRRLNDLQAINRLEQYTVTVTIEAAKAIEAGLELTYMLPGASWEPAHELRATGREPGTVELASYAVVSQTTGEDWEDATISFSTQSATDSMSIPQLDAMLLANTRAVRTLAGQANQSFQVAQKQHQSLNDLYYNYVNPNDNAQLIVGNNLRLQQTQARVTQIFTRLKKRGTTAHFAGAGKPLVRSDGRGIRVPIGTVTLDSTTRLVAAPIVSLNTARVVEMINTGEQPLLPGSVALYHDGAYLGKTEIEFTAEGETLAVFLGVADHVKLARTMDRKNSTFSRGRKHRIAGVFDLTVENLSSAPTTLELADRIPVSENKDIKVSRVDIEPDAEPDKKGIIKWTVTIPAKGSWEGQVGYTIEYSPEVVRSMRSKSSMSPAQTRLDADISVQIEDLEMQF